MVEVKMLWDELGDDEWDCGAGLLKPSLFYPTGVYQPNPSPEIDAHYLRGLKRHQDTITFWIHRFKPYVGREDEIPKEWAIQWDLAGGIDGMHRLTAAKVVSLTKLPYFC
jgi:hypothetical protein